MNKIITLLCVAATFLFVACESSESVENESGGLSVYLNLPPALSVDTVPDLSVALVLMMCGWCSSMQMERCSMLYVMVVIRLKLWNQRSTGRSGNGQLFRCNWNFPYYRKFR